MPSTFPSDAPTWFIVLEYLRVLLTPTLLTLAFVVLMISMRKVLGIQCSTEQSALIDRTCVLADEVAKRARNGELPVDAMVKHLEGTASVLAQIKRAKDIGNRNPIKEAIHNLLRQKATEKSSPE